MTDEQIIKALGCCGAQDCGKCPYAGFTKECGSLSILALDLINRQKAENEKLDKQCQAARRKILSLCGRLHNATTENAELKQKNRKYINRIEKDIVLPTIFGEQARTEAIKEFAERAKMEICKNTYAGFDKKGKPVNIWGAKIGFKAIDNLVKEMTEGQE